MNAIETTGLRKVYGDLVAVNDLNLTIGEGELFALLGVNGAGKTTTVKMLTTLVRPSAGDARLMGHSILNEANAVKEIADISMQETAVARNLTVRENLRFYARLSGQSREEAERTEQKLCDALDLKKVLNTRAGRLSGGWQRKVSIALALASGPRILFLDEPTLGLDVLARRELWKTIETLKGAMTVVLTTHYMEEAEALADRIGIMKDGRLLFCGTKEELFAQTGADSVENAFILLASGGESHA